MATETETKLEKAAADYVSDLDWCGQPLTGREAELFEEGARWAFKQAIHILMQQHKFCQPGTLVSYHIAAEILAVELREKEY
jgi:hypothetical protein